MSFMKRLLKCPYSKKPHLPRKIPGRAPVSSKANCSVAPSKMFDRVPNGTKFSRMDQEKFVEDSFQKNVLGPFLNTLSQVSL